ncbi:MAG TPA: hypothetical protein VG734_10300 [Lacunisphaera sp.]|nr:hypothetical protein [Lacunisphaera sp.]
MHDFIRHLSFSNPAPFAAAQSAAEPMRCVTSSFNEAPTSNFPPSPRPPRRKLPARVRSEIVNRRS